MRRSFSHAVLKRSAFWTVMAGSLAVAIAAPWQGQDQGHLSGRKSTDPPVASVGKYCQDLFFAIDHRSNAEVQALLKKGADPNSRNGLEFTPLCIAAASWQPDVMQTLIANGATIDATSSYGTPLSFAALSGDFPGAQILLEHGANPKVARSDGMTVLMMASNSGAVPIVGELLKRGVDVNAKAECGSTALTYAARNGFTAVAKLLLDSGADANSYDVSGRTPLMEAAVAGHADVVKLLLEKGAKPNAKDRKRQTALMLAAGYGDYPEVVKALLAGGADAKLADETGRTAPALAQVRGFAESSALLGSPAPNAVMAVGKVRTPEQAIPISLNLLQGSMNEFASMTGCVSCHQEGIGRLTTAEAASRGFRTDAKVQKLLSERVLGGVNAMKPLHEMALKDPEAMKQLPLIEINEVSTGDCWLLAGMAAHKEPATDAVHAMTMVLARQQTPGGFWSFSLPRTPMQSSFFTFTALAVKSLKSYGPAVDAPEIASRIAKARAWFEQTPAKTAEDRASRLLGLAWSGGSRQEIAKAATEVRATQRPDGGWCQGAGMPSDAYATGQALYALHVAGGMPTKDPVYKRGTQFLLRTQDSDGSWFVCKHAMPANNYFDAGFPHGESQYASFNGTCWATMALLQTVKR